MSGPAETSSEHGAQRARAGRPRGERARAWRRAGTVLYGAAYAAALAWASWNGSMATDDDGGTAPALAVAGILGWIALTVLLGYLLRAWAFAIIALAVVIPAFIGERADEFDEELRYFNWLLLIVINAAIAAIGVWLAHRRAATAPSA